MSADNTRPRRSACSISKATAEAKAAGLDVSLTTWRCSCGLWGAAIPCARATVDVCACGTRNIIPASEASK